MKATIGTNISAAAELLIAGELVGIPTETVYGLAANALDVQAVLRIFETKKRPAFDPLIVHTHSPDTLGKYVGHVPELALSLFGRFSPGPLTMLLPKKDIIPDLVTSGLPNVAIRIPAHPLALDLLRSLPFPLAAPSANPFGYISPTTAGHVADQLGDDIPYILDGGPCGVGVESTIIGIEANDRVTVYRLGGLSVDALQEMVGDVQLTLNNSSNPASPGMLKSHYAPRKPFFCGDIAAMLPQFEGKKIGILSFREMHIGAAVARVALSPDGDLHEAARNLFAAMRDLDTSGADYILAEYVPDEGLGRAINDRLRRAAAED